MLPAKVAGEPAHQVVAGLLGLPGEIFVEFGLMIKRRSPFGRTDVASYADGGYLMVDRAVEPLEELYER